VKFTNASKVQAGWTMGFDRDGREMIIVAVKATFLIPRDDREPVLAPEQVKMTDADQFTGEPGLSAPLYECDFAHRKPKCDVLLNGSAYTPRNRVTNRVTISLQVGSMRKSFDVVGDRIWRSTMFRLGSTDAEDFQVMPITYDRAYGGTDVHPDKPEKIKTYLANPAGRGYYPLTRDLDGKPLPNTEETGSPATGTNGSYRPMSFGFLGRNWPPRVKYAGTYDQKWLDNQSPFWPDDFDYRHFQATPEDQQISYPPGGEEVVLVNLTPHGVTRFKLPRMSMPVVFLPNQARDFQLDGTLDTVLIEPDKQRFMLTWRVTQPMKKSCFDMREVIVGQKLKVIRRARLSTGKRRFKNLAELIQALPRPDRKVQP
jgi:hypothetical protein